MKLLKWTYIYLDASFVHTFPKQYFQLPTICQVLKKLVKYRSYQKNWSC